MLQKPPGGCIFKLDNFVETSGARANPVSRWGGSGVSCQYVVAAREPGTFTLTAGRPELGAQKRI